MTDEGRDRGRRGLTLTELLVVMSVLGILAALLMPVVMRAREYAHRTTCLANLRQIGIAFSMYVADWDGAFPNTDDPYLWMGRRWRWPLEPYLGQRLERDPDHPEEPLLSSHTPEILVCPSDDTAPDKWDKTSYGYSAAFYHTPGQIAAMTTDDLWKEDRFPCVTQKESSVAHPSKKVLCAEWLSNHDAIRVGWWDDRGARNYLFADGHVRYLRAAQLHRAATGYPDPNLTVGGITGKDVD